ncbi:DUF4419 domain-containing protein [Mucilaginibacter panaciglaebae]|uniref:DUF4419 domain-containing protein n=1 Tax=Mucilaginibacter panaciglaebae TaxID=502331 RepID=A0ABP7WY11_9SPHI
MKKINLITAVLLLCTLCAWAQKSRTFEIEKLDIIPGKWQPVMTYEQALQRLIISDNPDHTDQGVTRGHIFNIVAKSNIPGNIIAYKYTSFFDGLYFAYANHRPFTLSPDMMWLLISQGFSQHVLSNAEDLRSLFVKHAGKKELTIVTDKIYLDDPNAPWEEIFPEMSKQIAANTGEELTNTVTADFSTTTPITKVASQITLMKAMSAYFNYNVLMIGCGIPSITLQGTTKDWESLLAKTEALRKYKLDWWVNELEPELKQFIAASKGKIDKEFWKAMFKYHSPNGCGAPTTIDGWIVKFYPYNKMGKRNDLKQIIRGVANDVMPDEIVKVDLNYELANNSGSILSKTPLELWAGFVGLKEDPKTFNLTPVIGWMIRKKDLSISQSSSILNKLKEHVNGLGGINITVSSVPPELMQVGPIKRLSINFTDEITFPDALAKIPIDIMWLNGRIDEKGKNRIAAMFPNTQLYINGQAYGKVPKGGNYPIHVID